ncbi:MAG TPA: SDR family oxidoreductase [Actinomycetota bacterium]|nr:SDR family oxidoreductase [Actinomycetota bacterium]
MGALRDKVIVVTGASRGLGEAMALGFASENATLVLAARTVPDLERVADACREAGAGDVKVVPTDITSEEQVQHLVDETLSAFGRIDTFVANAGASYLTWTEERFGHLTTYPREIVERLFELNTIGTWLCMKAALPAMKEGSSFINVGSETGRLAMAGMGFYAVSKATIDTMTTIASKEMADQGVRVNCLTPGGMVDTHLFGPNKMPPQMRERVPHQPPDVIVPAAIWLASDDSRDVNGAFVVGREFNSRPVEETRAALVTS